MARIRLPDEVYEYIKEQVVELFYEYDIKCTPISAFEVAIKMGMTVWPYSSLGRIQRKAARMISDDGFSIETEDHKWIIFYNDAKSYGRINNTIMHEIAHFWLGHTKETDYEEAEAKFFAKYALAPPPLVHNMGEEITVENIQNRFDISFDAASNAYNYYEKWKKKKCINNIIEYSAYELKMMQCFE
ncbi:ImmA/IrrE family metallo-endopeptidase [Butyrivibrio fibrisolvens]|uniref:ImmA/IrrE family metallo-endopeptidase n=1 Tax=Butyrivibrio fibrisolvens TaxID=831 RepID=UPI00040FE278|nr:ImmA/IrrE family metallo-endopeptidase [Butyrivibrio fibrisolvens]